MNICTHCQKEYKVSKNSKGVFCSLTCQGQHTAQRVVDTWLNNQTPENFYTASNQPRTAIRRWLIKQHNCQCSRCGWGEKIPNAELPALEIEHIDGDWTNCVKNNITILCPNCHSLTPTYKARNRGNGRAYRRQP